MNSNIFFFLLLEDGLSVTTTKDGLFDEALINPHDPSAREKRTPFTVNNIILDGHEFDDSTRMRVLSEERTHWPINHRASSELWDLQAEILTELSRRVNVEYRVKATEESRIRKLSTL